jgi:hypothetical protein
MALADEASYLFLAWAPLLRCPGALAGMFTVVSN